MKMLIDIPDEWKIRIEHNRRPNTIECGQLVASIWKGTPLPKGEWIPVRERMPEDGQKVLFCDIDDDIMLGYHIKGRPDTHFSQDGTFDDMKNVRAWMPLPEPYKEGEE